MPQMIIRAPVHLGRLLKLAGIAFYSAIWEWLERLRTQSVGHVFASPFIHLKDAAAHASHLNRGYRDEPLLKQMSQRVADYTMVGYEGVATLIDQARHCEENGIPGAFVELGTCKGGCLGAMAMANLKFGRERREIHGFDSFEGIPKPRADLDDMGWAIDQMGMKIEECDGALQPANLLLSERSDVERLFSEIGYPREHLHLHVGWFQDTVPVAAPKIGPIAILRLDGDLYESYTVPLRYLWDQISPGGFLVIDDWILSGCRTAVTEFFQERGITSYLSAVDHSVRFLQKPH